MAAGTSRTEEDGLEALFIFSDAPGFFSKTGKKCIFVRSLKGFSHFL